MSTTIVAGESLARVFAEQWEVEHDHSVGASVEFDLSLNLSLHRRVHYAI